MESLPEIVRLTALVHRAISLCVCLFFFELAASEVTVPYVANVEQTKKNGLRHYIVYRMITITVRSESDNYDEIVKRRNKRGKKISMQQWCRYRCRCATVVLIAPVEWHISQRREGLSFPCCVVLYVGSLKSVRDGIERYCLRRLQIGCNHHKTYEYNFNKTFYSWCRLLHRAP